MKDLNFVGDNIFYQFKNDQEAPEVFDLVVGFGKLKQANSKMYKSLLEFAPIRVAHVNFKKVRIQRAHQVEKGSSQPPPDLMS